MAQRPTAGASEGRPVRSGAVPSGEQQHQDTARIVVHVAGKELPSWFWGAVGCFSVLAVGLSVLFVLIRPSGTESATGAQTTPGAIGLAGASPASAGRGGIQVEPMAAPAAQTPSAAPKARPMARAIKVARTASRPSESTPALDVDTATAEKPEKADRAEKAELTEGEANEAELLAPRRKPRPSAPEARAPSEESE